MTVLLRPVDGGNLIKIHDEKTIIGRGPFLQVTDKRVSRHHAFLEIIKGDLVLTPTHTNPCFLRAIGVGEQAKILPRDKTRVLKHGEVFGLLPTQFYYKVIYKNQQESDVRSDSEATDKSEDEVTPKKEVVEKKENKKVKKAAAPKDKETDKVEVDKAKEESEVEGGKEEDEDSQGQQSSDDEYKLDKNDLPPTVEVTKRAAVSKSTRGRGRGRGRGSTRPPVQAEFIQRSRPTRAAAADSMAKIIGDYSNEEASDFEDVIIPKTPSDSSRGRGRGRGKAKPRGRPRTITGATPQPAPKSKKPKKRTADSESESEFSNANNEENDVYDDLGNKKPRAASLKVAKYVAGNIKDSEEIDWNQLGSSSNADSHQNAEESDFSSNRSPDDSSESEYGVKPASASASASNKKGKKKAAAAATPAKRGRPKKVKAVADIIDEDDYGDNYVPRPTKKRQSSMMDDVNGTSKKISNEKKKVKRNPVPSSEEEEAEHSVSEADDEDK